MASKSEPSQNHQSAQALLSDLRIVLHGDSHSHKVTLFHFNCPARKQRKPVKLPPSHTVYASKNLPKSCLAYTVGSEATAGSDHSDHSSRPFSCGVGQWHHGSVREHGSLCGLREAGLHIGSDLAGAVRPVGPFTLRQ